jgi:drug/metabolite transporter (DMT)-like permease
VATGAAVVAALILPFLALPAPASLPYLGTSAVLQVVYFALVAAAYRAADMSFAYPLMRGTAPLIVAAASGVLLGEVLSARALVGVALICGSVLTSTWLSRRGGSSFAPAALALTNAVVIAAYTLVDGIGARLSGGAVIAYTLWLSLLTGPPLIAFAAWRDAGALLATLKARWWVALGGGLATLGSYGLALFAMTLAPVATVAALRETSILFGMLIAGLLLKERVGPARIAVGIAIALGAAMLRLA